MRFQMGNAIANVQELFFPTTAAKAAKAIVPNY